MKLIIYFACCLVLAAADSKYQGVNLFRSDYQYYRDADGWFKFHQMPVRWEAARLRCAYEGAMLASPTTLELSNVLRSTAATHRVAVYTGIHGTEAEGDFNSLDGFPLHEIPLKWKTGSPDNFQNNEKCIVYHGDGLAEDVDCKTPYPYICYKKHSRDLVMTNCGTTDREYNMDPRTKKCYKFHSMGTTYSVAAGICTAEGGNLAIINSDIEAEVIVNLMAQNPKENVSANYPEIRLGYYKWDNSNFFGTVHGQSIKEAGYARWSANQPSHYHNNREQRCGGVFRHGTLDDTFCDENLAFICEKHPDSLHISTIDIRFGQTCNCNNSN